MEDISLSYQNKRQFIKKGGGIEKNEENISKYDFNRGLMLNIY